MALTGAAAGFVLQWWVHTSAYPLVISGKPFFTWPAFIPITFEVAVLFGALGAVFGMLGLNRLPMHHHPLFQSKVFERASDDTFFISIESWDPRFDPSATRDAAGVRWAHEASSSWSPDDLRTRSRRAAARAGHDPAGALVEPHSAHCRRRRPAGGGGLRDSGAGESEAVLLLVARVVPVLHEPGPRRALFRADPVRGPGRLGGRAATDRGDDLLHDSRDGGPVRPAALRPARSLRMVPRRRGGARRAAGLEGALPQRAVFPDPGGAVLWHLVLHRRRLLPRLARLRTRRAITRCRRACANSPGPRSSSWR